MSGKWAPAVALLALALLGATPPAPDLEARVEALEAAGRQARPEAARHLVMALTEELPPQELPGALAGSVAGRLAALRALAVALTEVSGAEVEALAGYLAAAARAATASLAEAGPPWEIPDLATALGFLLLDPPRFAEDASLRARALPVLRGGVSPELPELLRRELLHHVNQVPGLEYPQAEEIALAWGLLPRPSEARRRPFEADEGEIADDLCAPIAASLFVLPSTYVLPQEAVALLTAVRRLAPERRVLAMVDAPQRRALEPLAEALELVLLDSHGRPFSPWPRDPLTWARRGDGGVLALVRPDRQPGREEDTHLGPALSAALPPALDRAWRELAWAEAPTPFHNGQMLATPDALWISLHTVEHRALEILGLDRVPVASFAEPRAIDAYLAAAEKAAGELAALYRRPVRWVHAWPREGDPEARVTLMRSLGAGAGYDLDSWLTLVPGNAAGWVALVGDLEAGRELLESLEQEELDEMARAYGLVASGEALHRALVRAQGDHRGADLRAFLDQVAAELATADREVRRLPLLRVPTALHRDAGELEHAELLISWNNVVVEQRGAEVRAEGFSSLLPSADRRAEELYAAAGVRLELLPPLLGSVLRNGGYRCASSQLREPSREPPGARGERCSRTRRSAGSDS